MLIILSARVLLFISWLCHTINATLLALVKGLILLLHLTLTLTMRMSEDARAGKRRSMSRTLPRAMLAAAVIAATAAGAAVGVAAALAQRGSKKEGSKRPYTMSRARNILPAPFSLDTFAATLVQLNVPFDTRSQVGCWLKQ